MMQLDALKSDGMFLALLYDRGPFQLMPDGSIWGEAGPVISFTGKISPLDRIGVAQFVTLLNEAREAVTANLDAEHVYQALDKFVVR